MTMLLALSWQSVLATQPVLQTLGFNGQLTDTQSQWQYLGKGYRAYNPVLHRFMAQDSASPFHRGGVNGYAFALNNPVSNFDHSGHFAILNYLPHDLASGVGLGASIVVGAVGMLAGPAGAIFGAALGGAAGTWVTDGIQTHYWSPAFPVAQSAIMGAGLALGTELLIGAGAGAYRLYKTYRNSGDSFHYMSVQNDSMPNSNPRSLEIVHANPRLDSRVETVSTADLSSIPEYVVDDSRAEENIFTVHDRNRPTEILGTYTTREDAKKRVE